MNEAELRRRIDRVRERISAAAARSGRPPDAVEILPVTKGHAARAVTLVRDAGLVSVGENRVAEAEAKRESVGSLGLRWHLVGHLQRNKAARAIRAFDVIESVDSLRLAERLDRLAREAGRPRLPVLVEVNCSGEASKGGLPAAEALPAIARICALQGLRVDGLMTMAPLTGDETVLRAVFTRARELLEACATEVPDLPGRTLSMGMSNDFEIAVEEGSTRVRLGTILFGERPR
ncbi:MAG: YggS family pyridoxal phosphate-dependent enzyme [Gemmatimonadota bacterium]